MRVTGSLRGAHAENIEGEENVKVKMRRVGVGWNDRWSCGLQDAGIYFKEQTTKPTPTCAS